MEARWGADALILDKERLVLAAGGKPEVMVPLSGLLGFAVVETSAPAEGTARMTSPDALLVVAWQELGVMRRAQMPVPREGLQVQLALARLAQLKPDADMRALPRSEMLGFFEVSLPPEAQEPKAKRGPALAVVLLVLGVLAAALITALAQKG